VAICIASMKVIAMGGWIIGIATTVVEGKVKEDVKEPRVHRQPHLPIAIIYLVAIIVVIDDIV